MLLLIKKKIYFFFMSRLNFAPLSDAFFLGSEQIRNTQEEINKKTAAFQRWLVDDWNFEIIKNMEIKISGMRNYFTEIPTNTFMMKRKTSSTQKQISTTGNFEIKFCFNCGTENKGFQFCPNCGTNLKQA